ncbi:MAG: sensor domain-containing diguanylate cyclase [Armatimonadota bacterium]|nr:sensor domain-containing diguanylate cyclase [Armatimonadota bacterium]MCX7777963.1 sensor domain-containing diguanylate cyclase [Armatimonadota bacterium]MDW8025280.1 sensor domain-containing diguanylate cyclase [Armatimonadota bacterium]
MGLASKQLEQVIGVLERSYRVMLWSTHARWIGLGLAVFTLTGAVEPNLLTGAVMCFALYNLAIVLLTASPRRYRRWHRIVIVGVPAIDLLAVTAAVSVPTPNVEILTAFYLLPIVNTCASFKLAWGLMVTGFASIMLWVARYFLANQLLIPIYGAWVSLFFFSAFGTVFMTPFLHRVRAIDELFRRIEELYQLGGELLFPERLGAALQMAVDTAHVQLEASHTLLYIYSPTSKLLELRHFQPSDAADEFPLSISAGQGVVGHVFQTGAPLLFGELAVGTPGMASDDLTQQASAYHTFMAVPVRAGGNIVGVLAVYGSRSRDPFTHEDLRLMSLIAAHIASAIENTRLLQELQQMAQTDQLTGVYNRRYFDLMLQREYNRALRYSYPLSLIMFDLDNFKQCNDRFGHAAGDEILAKVGEVLRKNLRDSDIPARYGGEEFAVILPHTPLTGAKVAAERIRKLVEQLTFSFGNPPVEHKVTISAGIAALGPTVFEPHDLVRAADEALLRAKAAGKNRVEVMTSAEFTPVTALVDGGMRIQPTQY